MILVIDVLEKTPFTLESRRAIFHVWEQIRTASLKAVEYWNEHNQLILLWFHT